MRIFKNIILSFTLALALAGCVSQNDTGCRFSFSFTQNSDHDDHFAEVVGDLRLYAFDEGTGILTGIVHANSKDIERGWMDISGLPEGTYTFVAWGGGSDLEQDFSTVHMLDAATDTHRPVEIGVTTLDDLYMILNYEKLPGDAEGEIAPLTDDFDELFHAVARNVSIPHSANRPASFEFTRNTNVLKISVSGLDMLESRRQTRATAGQPLKIFSTGRNGRYQWDNSIDEYAPLMRYEPPYHTLTENSTQVDIKTLRLDIERHTGDNPVLLYIQDATTGRNLIDPLDVVAAILQNPDYNNQSDIDSEYEFNFDIAIEPGDNQVTVTGVEVWPQTLTIEEGESASLSVIVSPSDATEKGVVWLSSNPAVATVDATGVVTAIGKGTATITAITVDGSKTATCAVTVVPKGGYGDPVPVTGIELSPTAFTLKQGSAAHLTASISPEDATDKSVIWTTSNASVATVDVNGVVTAIGPGTATITATTVDGNYTASSSVTVTPPDGPGGVRITISIDEWEVVILTPEM